MSTSGFRTRLALAVLAMVVAIPGCSAPAALPTSPAPPTSSLRPTPSTDTAPGSAQTSDASDEALPPDQDGHPACAAYDSWRPGAHGAGITITFWYEGTDPVTATVRQPGTPDLSQTVDDDLTQRYHDFEFLDVDPTAVTEVLSTTGTTSCYVRAVPAP